MKAIKIVIVIFVSCLPFITHAQDKVGTSAVPFLGIGVGADAMGMGGAVVSSSRDASMLYWNPGALALEPKTMASFNQNQWLVNTTFNWFGATIAVSDASIFGLQFGFLDYGSDKVRTVSEPEGTGELWTASDMYLGVSYAQALTDQFAIGGTGKLIRSQIWNETGTAFALDIGLIYSFGWNGLMLGMSLSNFGTDMKYEGKDLFRSTEQSLAEAGQQASLPAQLKVDEWPLPLYFRVGVSMDAYRDEINHLLVSIDANRPTNNSEFLNLGFKYLWNDMVAIKGGYQALGKADAKEGYTVGFGLYYPVFGYVVKFDMSYQSWELFENASILTYGVGFEL